MQNNEQKTVQGWRALAIMLGVAGFVLLATWAMNDRDHTTNIAKSTDSEKTVGLAPQR